MGCTLSLLTAGVLLLIYSLFEANIIQNIGYFMQNGDAWVPWRTEVDRNSGIILFTAFMCYAVGLIQFLVLVLPFAFWISKGLEIDQQRSWLFFVATGALIGSAPWVAWVAFSSYYENWDMESAALLLCPGLTTGLVSGALLKRRLNILALQLYPQQKVDVQRSDPLSVR